MDESETAQYEAVTQYLTYLSDPQSLIDTDEIERLQQQLSETNDPAERLQIQSRISQVSQPDEDHLRQQFERHAKQWADENNVSHQAFIKEGVAPQVLAAAGFEISASDRASVDDVVSAIQAKAHQFTVKQLMDETGASRATVNKAINLLGNRQAGYGDNDGPGAPPVLYDPIQTGDEE